MGEFIFLLLLAVVGVMMLWETTSYPNVGFADRVTGPAKFPQMIIVFILICIAIFIIMKIVNKEKTKFIFWELFRGNRLFLNVAVIFYVLTLSWLGFILSTSIFLIATTAWLRFKDTGEHGVAGFLFRSAVMVVAIVGIYFLFTKVLVVTLPRGFIPL